MLYSILGIILYFMLLFDHFYWCIFFFVFSSALNMETNENVAIKKIANAFDNKVDAKRTLREIKLLRHMDHENVSQFNFCFDAKFLILLFFMFCVDYMCR